MTSARDQDGDLPSGYFEFMSFNKGKLLLPPYKIADSVEFAWQSFVQRLEYASAGGF